MNRIVKSSVRLLFSAIYPERCPCCGRLQRDDTLCAGCRVLLKRLPDNCCKMCGHEKVLCECSVRPMRSDGFCSPFYNAGRAQEGLYRFKFGGALKAAEFFAGEMAERFTETFPDVVIDEVCCVPADRKTIRRRGYNHAAVLAEMVATRLNVPFNSEMLFKVGRNRPQHTLKRRDRMTNVKGIYTVNCDVKGKTVLLIDDIKTTGSTLNECSHILKKAKAKEVYTLTALLGRNLQ